MGRREFYSSLVAPSTDVDYLETCYDTTDRLIETDAWMGIKQDLRPIIDIDRLCRKISRTQVSPKDIAELAFSLRSSLKVWDRVKEVDLAGLRVFGDSVREDIVSLLGEIEKDIDVDKAIKIHSLSIDALGNMEPTESLFLVPGAEEAIDSACAECDKSMTQLDTIRSTLSGLIGLSEKKTVKSEFVKIHDTPKMPPCLVATSRRATLLKSAINEKGGIAFAGGAGVLIADDLSCVAHSSTKNATVIASPGITSICQSIHKSRERMINDIIVFFKQFVETLSLDLGRIARVSRFLAWADVAQCRAYVATKYGFTRPECVKFSMWSFIEAKGLRHPLVEHLQTRETYVANDVDLCAGGMLLYGTNAVGKTCLIRSIGIAVIMAQSGLHVSASGFRFAPYKNIFTRIVGNDDIFKGLSTFAVEMSELRTILENADNSSLVLGDELCSGTESGSARSIFMAGIEWLSKTNASFLFATHFHEINDYPELAALDNVTLNHMEVRYDSEAKELIYDRKLRDGPGFSSYGLEVCKALSLPDDFLARAHEIRRVHDPTTKDVLESKGSRYNAGKLKGSCEMCGAEGVEVHHLVHQKNADRLGRTSRGHHKNHPANLMNICEACHDNIHEKGAELRRTKTTSGYKLEAI
jgi:DNA mismatch repair protein MutS